MSLKLSEVKNLHGKGLALIYLRPKSKMPWEKGWTTGERKSWDELENSFEKTNNLGVRLGAPSKMHGGYLACIDVDVKQPSGKKPALAKLKEITGTKDFPTVLSGSGGGSRHLYCITKEPFKMITVAKEKSWEICIYSTGRQMVLPPSTHPDTGFQYVWWPKPHLNVKDLPLFDVSNWQEEATTISNGSVDTEGFKAVDVDLWASSLPVPVIRMIVDGDGCEDRSASLLSIAMTMCRGGFTDNEILSVLTNPDNFIAGAAYEHTASNSRKKAVGWVRRYTLEKARHNTDVMRYFDNPPSWKERQPVGKKEAAKTNEAIEEEANEVLPDKTGKGKPATTLRNLVHILEKFMGGGLVAFNEFSCRPYFVKDTPYGGRAGQEIADHHDLNLKAYVADHYGFEPGTELCWEAHTLIARKYGFHPVKKYLESLEWDGTPRLDTWLESAFGAYGPRDYLRAVSRKVLVAAVSRIYEPGCKFDYVLVLEGKQGEGKSMSLGILASQPWFTDGLGDIHNKDVVDQMTGKWIIELAELASIRGKENEHIKSFFSRQVDRVRMSYGRRSEDYPRQSVFIGSTNSQEYFTDETGNRRYWPVHVSKANRQWLEANRDQLWAEAMVRHELGEDLYLSKELEERAAKEQEKRFEVDEWEAEIKKIVEKDKGPHIVTNLWRAINSNMANGHPSMSEAKRIGAILRRLGFEKRVLKIDKVDTKCWGKT